MKQTLRLVFFRVLLPTMVLLSLILFLHWLILAAWFYFGGTDADTWKMAFVGIAGTTVPVWVFDVIAARRILVKGYAILHERIVGDLIMEACRREANRLLQQRELNSVKDSLADFLIRLNTWLKEKMVNWPRIIRWIVNRGVRRIGYTPELEEVQEAFRHGDSEKMAVLLNTSVGKGVVEAVNSILPPWLNYLILVDLALLVALFVI